MTLWAGCVSGGQTVQKVAGPAACWMCLGERLNPWLLQLDVTSIRERMSEWLQPSRKEKMLAHHCIFLRRPCDNFQPCLWQPKLLFLTRCWDNCCGICTDKNSYFKQKQVLFLTLFKSFNITSGLQKTCIATFILAVGLMAENRNISWCFG